MAAENWGTNAGQSVEPPQALKDEGFDPQKGVGAQFLNWLFYTLFDWLSNKHTLASGNQMVVLPKRNHVSYTITPTANTILTFDATNTLEGAEVRVKNLSAIYKVVLNSSDGDTIESFLLGRATTIYAKQAVPTDKTHWAFLDSGPVCLERQTLSAAATCDFTTGIDGIAEQYEIRFRLLPASDGVSLLARVAIAGSFKAGVNDYVHGVSLIAFNGVPTDDGSSGNTSIVIATNIGNVSDEGISGKIIVAGPSAGNQPKIQLDANSRTATAIGQRIYGGGRYTAAATGGSVIPDGIRLLFSSGNIASGYAELWRIGSYN